MKRVVDVHTGEIMAGNEESILHSDASKACLLIAAYDSVHKIGGLAHATFYTNGSVRKKDFSVTRDASAAIDEMVEDMKMIGSKKEDIEVCLVAGENVPHEKDDPDYHKTLNSVVDLLKSKDIKFKKETAADIGNLHASLNVENGKLTFS